MAEMKKHGGTIHRKETSAQENATRKIYILRSRGKYIWRNKSPPPNWFQDGLLYSSHASGEPKLIPLCVLTCVETCCSLQCPGKSLAHSTTMAVLPCFISLPSPSPFLSPAEIQLFNANSLWVYFFVQFYINNLVFNAFSLCLYVGKHCFKYRRDLFLQLR